MSEEVESKVVTAVGISVTHSYGDDASARLEKAMSDAVMQCTAEGLHTGEENSAVIKERMMKAHDDELAKIEAERTA